MKHKLLLIAALALLGAVCLVWCYVVCFVDPFLVGLFGYLLLWATAPCLVFALIWLAALKARDLSTRPPIAMIVGVIGITCIAWLTVTANRWVHDRAEEAAKQYPEMVAPLLEDYRLKHGAYPRSLEQLPEKPPVPRLLRGPFSYQSDGRSYSFTFPQPGGLIDVWDYDSETRTWHLST